jgi:beta-catenin-like protein 1
VKQRVHQILNQRKASVKTIRNIVREYAGNIGDDQVLDVAIVIRVLLITLILIG